MRCLGVEICISTVDGPFSRGYQIRLLGKNAPFEFPDQSAFAESRFLGEFRNSGNVRVYWISKSTCDWGFVDLIEKNPRSSEIIMSEERLLILI